MVMENKTMQNPFRSATEYRILKPKAVAVAVPSGRTKSIKRFTEFIAFINQCL